MAAVVSGYIRFSYTPSGGSATYVDLPFLVPRGLDDPDQVEFFPAIKNEYIDGGEETLYKAFRRLFTIDLGVVADRSNRLALLYWMIDNNRTIDYNTGSYSEAGLSVVPKDEKGFQNVWLNGFVGNRHIVLDLKESSVRTTFPV